jgi:uncharacterized protein with FMN-binding domain
MNKRRIMKMKKASIVLMIAISLIVMVACTPKADTAPISPTVSSIKPTAAIIELEKYNELLELSQQLVDQLIKGDLTEELIEKLEEAGFKRESIDLIKTALQESVTGYKDGVYVGVAGAHNGDITVEVTITSGKIAFVRVLDHSETAPALPEVFNSLPYGIIKNQSTNDVDVISGATQASDGYLAAVEDALSKAK